MKLKAKSINAIGTILFSLGFSMPAFALPLQVGVYRVGSRYIQIAQQGNRLCFRGFSINGVTTASISPDSEHSGFYLINGLDDTVVHQKDLKTLFIGQINNLEPYEADYEFPRNISDDLQRCLQSQKPFFERISGGRGSRS
jgi:hypothetical protein